MTPIIAAISSILGLTGLVWIARRALGFRVCPICAGVSLTWGWMLVGVFTNQLPITDYQLPIAMLMGGSVVGIAYQAEKLRPLRDASAGKLLLWKTFFMPTGFALVYLALARSWFAAAGAAAALAAIALAFLAKRPNTSRRAPGAVAELEEKMKKCC